MASNQNVDMTDALHSDSEGDDTDARAQPSSSIRLPTMSEADFKSLRYTMNHPKRGVAVIINNYTFHTKPHMHSVTGSKGDVDAMYALLYSLRFEEILTFENLNADQMKANLKKVAKMDHTDNDCFVCVILSRGEEGYVFATDIKISVDELVQPFKGDACSSLTGKPKLFFIQACRSTTPPKTEMSSGTETGDVEVIRSIPTEADILMTYAVLPENPQSGVNFIKAVADVVAKNWSEMDLLTMLTRANKRVASEFESFAPIEFKVHKNQIPCITSMLTKELYFTK